MKHLDRAVTVAGAVVVCVIAACAKSSSTGEKMLAGHKFDPDAALQLTEKFHDMIYDGSFAAYQAPDLYSAYPGEGGTFSTSGTLQNGTACSATLAIHPAKTSGRLKKKNLIGNNGYVLARIDNTTPDCTASGIYHVLGAGGSGAIIARSTGGNSYEARIGRFPAADTAVMAFTFCGHGKTGDNDKAAWVDNPGGDPCVITRGVSRDPNTRTSSGEVFSPTASRLQGGTEIAWLGCSDDCCPASQPPDTSMTRSMLRVKPTTSVALKQ